MKNKALYLFTLTLIISVFAETTAKPSKLVTQTVYGFLDFVTTIGNTVMIFSPETAPFQGLEDKNLDEVNVIETKPIENITKKVNTDISPTKLVVSDLVRSDDTQLPLIQKSSHLKVNETEILKQVQINNKQENEQSEAYIESNLKQPEYDLLSRQPTQYIEESFRVMNLDSSPKNNALKRKTITDKNNLSSHFDVQTNSPTVRLNKTDSKNIVANIRETRKTVGNRSSTKKGLSFQSSSQSLKQRNSKVNLPSTVRILKTVAPTPAQETTRFPETINHISSKGIRPQISKSKKNRNKNSAPLNDMLRVVEKTTEHPSNDDTHKKSFRQSKIKRRNKHNRSHTLKNTPYESSTKTLRSKSNEFTPEIETSLSVYMFKLNRAPGRWQYKTSPKPKVSIRKPIGDTNISYIYSNESISVADLVSSSVPKESAISDQIDLEPLGSQNGAIINNVKMDNNKFVVETVNIEISTPADFQDKYYEIATIKTPYIFQAGVLKKTRLITVTSTIEKLLEPKQATAESFEGPLTENILHTTKLNKQLLYGSITTLQPIVFTNGEETPSLETLTETYTFTQEKLGTEIVPIIQVDKNHTSFITVIQTFAIQNLITVTKTVLHGSDELFASLHNLHDFNANLDEAGSEINLELDFGDSDNSESEDSEKITNQKDNLNILSANVSLLTTNINQSRLPNSNFYNLPSQNQGILTNGRQPIQPQSLWESYVVQIKKGPSTSFQTLSKLIGVIEKSEYNHEIITTGADTQSPFNPYILPPQFQTITSQLVQQEIVTETRSKILKLTFGARTAFTTLFSTNVLPKLVTSFVTTVMPVQHTPTFPGYYPPPYHPFPYVG